MYETNFLFQTSMAMTTSVVSGEPVLQVTTGCATAACVTVAQYAEDTVVKTYCCKDRLCNNGGIYQLHPSGHLVPK